MKAPLLQKTKRFAHQRRNCFEQLVNRKVSLMSRMEIGGYQSIFPLKIFLLPISTEFMTSRKRAFTLRNREQPVDSRQPAKKGSQQFMTVFVHCPIIHGKEREWLSLFSVCGAKIVLVLVSSWISNSLSIGRGL